ncbi:hypothetical protein L6164_031247 [Bauhinia variegata]|uniref:Uncharacterized protein n=1 Tax=Bauhinia variegata TaxID=167791 RepID=A0ACB9LG73_BAUVA|nr:hypothetical protein L6164_031247 [Bauhinia variegata]
MCSKQISTTRPNAKYCCTERVDFIKKNEHRETCIYTPCSCPHSECSFVSSCKELTLHFRSKHKDSAVSFRCRNPFTVTLNVEDKQVVLQEQNEGDLFVLNNFTAGNVENLVNVDRIGPNSSNSEVLCVIKFCPSQEFTGTNSGTLVSSLHNSSHGHHLHQSPAMGSYLLVPTAILGSYPLIKLEIHIFMGK